MRQTERDYSFLDTESHYLIGRPMKHYPWFHATLEVDAGITPFHGGALIVASIQREDFNGAVAGSPIETVNNTIGAHNAKIGNREEVRRHLRTTILGSFLGLVLDSGDDTTNMRQSAQLITALSGCTQGQVEVTATSQNFALIGTMRQRPLREGTPKELNKRIAKSVPKELTFGHLMLLNPE